MACNNNFELESIVNLELKGIQVFIQNLETKNQDEKTSIMTHIQQKSVFSLPSSKKY